MKEIFRERDYTRVGFCQSILEDAGIPTHVRNKDLVGTLTEVPIPEFFPALCVVHDEDYDRAVDVLRERFESDEARACGEDIACPKCGEENPANFDLCWSCQEPIAGQK